MRKIMWLIGSSQLIYQVLLHHHHTWNSITLRDVVQGLVDNFKNDTFQQCKILVFLVRCTVIKITIFNLRLQVVLICDHTYIFRINSIYIQNSNLATIIILHVQLLPIYYPCLLIYCPYLLITVNKTVRNYAFRCTKISPSWFCEDRWNLTVHYQKIIDQYCSEFDNYWAAFIDSQVKSFWERN